MLFSHPLVVGFVCIHEHTVIDFSKFDLLGCYDIHNSHLLVSLPYFRCFVEGLGTTISIGDHQVNGVTKPPMFVIV